MMRKFLAVSVAALALAPLATSHAATITTSFTDWAAAVGPGYTSTYDFGLPQYSGANSVELADGQTLSFSDDEIYNTPGGWTNLNGYSGQLIDTSFNNETIMFDPAITALGFLVNPDGGGTDSVTVTLSDGTTTTISDINFDNGATQFVGFYGGNVDSITVSFANAADFVFGNIKDVSVPVPEPMSMALLVAGLGGLSLVRRRGALIAR